jgi:hypothetical protein
VTAVSGNPGTSPIIILATWEIGVPFPDTTGTDIARKLDIIHIA